MTPLNIVYVGNFRHTWCTEVHIARDLRALGHKVECVQEQNGAGVRMLSKIEQTCRQRRAELLLFTRTWGLPTEAIALWRRLEKTGTVTASFHLDLYLGLARGADSPAAAAAMLPHDPFWTTQHVFTPDGDETSADWFADHGINHHWSPPAIVSDECTPGTWRDRFDYDVVFVGSERYHPEWPWRSQLIERLRAEYGDRFRRFAGDRPEGPIRGRDLNDLYASAKVVVGDSLALPKHANYWTDRYFETIGRGGFLIAPDVPGLDRFLLPGEDFIGYKHPTLPNATQTTRGLDRVVKLVNEWLERPAEERRAVAAVGQAHVAANHTYKHRMAAALNVMGIEPRTARAQAVPDRPARLGRTPIVERLELGSGYHPTPGFTHLDINPRAPQVDIVGPAFPLKLGDATVAEIRAVDVLEHLSYRDTAAALAEWARVLRPGGRLYVQVPDAGLIMDEYSAATTERGPTWLRERIPPELPQTLIMGAVWRLLGGHADGDNGRDNFMHNAHYALFDRDHLTASLTGAGFTVESMETNDHPNLCAWAVKA